MWDRQDVQTSEHDFEMYDSAPWMAAKFALAFCIAATAYLLYGLHELPWTLFGSVTGILILAFGPFLAGLVLGYSFESPRLALASSLGIGFAALAACFLLMQLPQMLGLAECGPGFMSAVWYYGFFIPFLITIAFVPAGAMVGSSTNVHE